MVRDCSFACHVLLSKGFFFRGAIVQGWLFHRDNIIFGPAVIEAYILESKEHFPVVKFSNELLRLARLFPTAAQKDYEDVEIEYIMAHASHLSRGYFYVDYFKDYGSIAGAGNQGTISHYNQIRNVIQQNLQNAKTLSVIDKMEWAKMKFNENGYVITGAINPITYRVPIFKKLCAYPSGIFRGWAKYFH